MFSHFVRKLRSLAAPDPEVVRVGALRWDLTPAGRELFGDTGPSLDSSPQVVVKQNLQRTISRVTLPNVTLYLKRCRANTPRAWVREILRPPKARLEFENAVRLRELGVPTTEPLGWAETNSHWPGDSFILTREHPNAVPLDEYLNQPLTHAKRREVAEELGHLFAKMHAAGVSHPDPHPGNFLYDGARFALLDVHAVRFGPPLKWAESRENLALFNRWFNVRAERTDRGRFWRIYRNRFSDLDQKALARELEATTEASNLRFWANRTDRYLGDNRQFRRVKAVSVRGHAVRDLTDGLVKRWLADPDAVFTEPGVKLLKDSRSSTVAELQSPPTAVGGLPDQIIFKRFHLKSPLAAVKNLFRRSPALRSWVFGHNLLDRHLPTARPLFVAHRYRFGIPCEGYIAFEKVPDATELPEIVPSLSRQEFRDLCEKLGRLVRLMHDRHVSHRDLKAPNVLVSGPERTPVLIDLVGLVVSQSVSAAVRVRDLTRLNASFVSSTAVTRTDRLRCLRAYLRTGEWRDWKGWWRRVAAGTTAKVLKNLQSGRPLG